MRTTLDIDEDVLLAVKEIAAHQRTSMGKVLSQLARQAFTQRPEMARRNGLLLFPEQPEAEVVTLDLVNLLRDEGA